MFTESASSRVKDFIEQLAQAARNYGAPLSDRPPEWFIHAETTTTFHISTRDGATFRVTVEETD